MKKYSKIGQLSSLVKNIVHSRQFVGLNEAGEPIFDKNKILGTVDLVGTVKLHGTNGGVRQNRVTKEITFQSRENVITPLKDNAGFAFYMDSIKEDLNSLFERITSEIAVKNPELVEKLSTHDILIFGEWAGMGIQSNVAISTLPKSFYIFDICLTSVGTDSVESVEVEESSDDDDSTDPNAENTADSVYLPMENYGNISIEDKKIYNLWNGERFPSYKITMDLENPKLVQNDIIAITETVEECCPVGKYFFDKIKGIKAVQSESDGKIKFSQDLDALNSLIPELTKVFKELRDSGESGSLQIELNMK